MFVLEIVADPLLHLPFISIGCQFRNFFVYLFIYFHWLPILKLRDCLGEF